MVKYGFAPGSSSNSVDALAPARGWPSSSAVASSSFRTICPPVWGGNASRFVKVISNENRIRCGAVRFVASSNSGIGADGVDPPGVAGVGLTVMPCVVSWANAPVGAGMVMLSAL